MRYVFKCYVILTVIAIHSQLLAGSTTISGLAKYNAFIHLSFYPTELMVYRGKIGMGFINVTVDSVGAELLPLSLTPCSQDPKIAIITDSTDFVLGLLNSSTIFGIHIQAHGLGRTRVRFYISKNNTYGYQMSARLDDMPHRTGSLVLGNATMTSDKETKTDQDFNRKKKLSSSESGGDIEYGDLNDRWWLPTEYPVVVTNKPNAITSYLAYVIMVLVSINMIGIGAQVEGQEVLVLLKKPWAVAVALFCRFGLMPAMTLGLVELLQPSPEVALGMLSLSCTQGEGVSNLFMILAEANLSVSATITLVNNFACVAMLPLWMIVFETKIYSTPGHVTIPFKEMFIIFSYMTAALLFGYFMSKRMVGLCTKYWTFLPFITVTTVVVILIIEIYSANFAFYFITAHTFSLAVLFVLSGYMFGPVAAFLCRQPYSKIGVIAIETGARTTFISSLILDKSLPQPESDIAKAAPMLSTLLSVLPAYIVILIYRFYNRYATRYAPPEFTCSESSSEDLKDLCNGTEILDTKETSI